MSDSPVSKSHNPCGLSPYLFEQLDVLKRICIRGRSHFLRVGDGLGIDLFEHMETEVGRMLHVMENGYTHFAHVNYEDAQVSHNPQATTSMPRVIVFDLEDPILYNEAEIDEAMELLRRHRSSLSGDVLNQMEAVLCGAWAS